MMNWFELGWDLWRELKGIPSHAVISDGGNVPLMFQSPACVVHPQKLLATAHREKVWSNPTHQRVIMKIKVELLGMKLFGNADEKTQKKKLKKRQGHVHHEGDHEGRERHKRMVHRFERS